MQRLLEYNRKDLRNWAGEELAAKFFDQRSKYPAPYNNLDYWISKKTPQELETYMNTFKSKNQKDKEERMEGAEKIYDDGRWVVILCKTYDAMKHYGKGTKWCIAGNYPGHTTRGQEYFDSYKQSRYKDYYVYIDRQGPEGNNKWCVCPLKSNPTTECDIWCAPDYTVDAIPGAPTIKGLPSVSAFVIDDGTLIKVKTSSNEKLEIPNTITTIGRKACFDLRTNTIIVPSSVTSVGSGAFAKSNITGMKLPDSVTNIGNALWLDCDRLQWVQIGSGVSKLTKNLCAYCENLNIVTINGSIDEIDDSWCDGHANKFVVNFNEDRNKKLWAWLRNNNIEGVSTVTGEIVTDREPGTERPNAGSGDLPEEMPEE